MASTFMELDDAVAPYCAFLVAHFDLLSSFQKGTVSSNGVPATG